ncbi:YD repeat-containing protein [Burkholderia cepacia]|uniref:YD repeat-containing protein n=1 Tax=Burkholderia cepacia TaxID=292 RepID=UPI001C2D3212
MNSSTAASPRDRQVAVVPVNEIPPADVALSISAFDDWLVRISNGAVTLDRIRTAAGVMPVLGNILALADVFGDIVTLVESKERHMLDWVSLGINLIGVVPLPGTAAARVSLRPTLFLVRQELRQNGKRFVGEALFNVLATNLNASIKGELEDFVAKAQAELPGFIEKAATYGEQLIVDLANGLDALVLGNLDASGSLDEAGDQLGGGSRMLVRRYRYDASGQLTDINDTRRGQLAYRYDPVGRLLEAQSRLGHETFAFDPASNLIDPASSARPSASACRASRRWTTCSSNMPAPTTSTMRGAT